MHTPTPWTHKEDGEVIKSPADWVAIIHNNDARLPNAALIVKAVNSYEAMREALKLSLRNMDNGVDILQS